MRYAETTRELVFSDIRIPAGTKVAVHYGTSRIFDLDPYARQGINGSLKRNPNSIVIHVAGKYRVVDRNSVA